MRAREIEQVAEALLSGESLLLVGEPGSGKTTLGMAVRSRLEAAGYTVGMVAYSGSAIDLLKELCEQFCIDLMTDDEKPKQKPAIRLKADLLDELKKSGSCLIADNADRWSSSLRYWLEDCWRAGALMLLLGWNCQQKDIYAKLPVRRLEPIKDDMIREIMRTEAASQGVKLSISDLSRLQSSTGNNPAIARRVVREAALGIGNEASAEHSQYIDGTPMLLARLAVLGLVRLIGLGLGDKSLYVIGGALTMAVLVLRTLLYAANRGTRKL